MLGGNLLCVLYFRIYFLTSLKSKEEGTKKCILKQIVKEDEE